MLFDLKVPLLGFDDVKQLELTKIDDIFMRMEVPQRDNPSFTLINPFILRDYSFDIPDKVQQLLEITDSSNLLIFNTVIVTSPMQNSTINLAAPFIFNTDNQTMAQIILSNQDEFGIAEPIYKYLNKEGN